jgi:hypothetical protein
MKRFPEIALKECISEFRAACRLPIDEEGVELVAGWLRPNFERILGHSDGGKRWADHGRGCVTTPVISAPSPTLRRLVPGTWRSALPPCACTDRADAAFELNCVLGSLSAQCRSQGKATVGWFTYRRVASVSAAPAPGASCTVKSRASSRLVRPFHSTDSNWCSA